MSSGTKPGQKPSGLMDISNSAFQDARRKEYQRSLDRITEAVALRHFRESIFTKRPALLLSK